MKDYQLRLVQEKEELDSKIEKLETYVDSAGFLVIYPEEQRLLNRQLLLMKEYSQILDRRLKISIGSEYD